MLRSTSVLLSSDDEVAFDENAVVGRSKSAPLPFTPAGIVREQTTYCGHGPVSDHLTPSPITRDTTRLVGQPLGGLCSVENPPAVDEEEEEAQEDTADLNLGRGGDLTEAEIAKRLHDSGRRLQGIVAWMDNCRGYGFLEESTTGLQFFVHFQSVEKPNPEYTQRKGKQTVPFKSLQDKEIVEFELEKESAEDIAKKAGSKKNKEHKVKMYKAVKVTGPNGTCVKGVPRSETIKPSGKQARGGVSRSSRRNSDEQNILDKYRRGLLVEKEQQRQAKPAEGGPAVQRLVSNHSNRSSQSNYSQGVYQPGRWNLQQVMNPGIQSPSAGYAGVPSLVPPQAADLGASSDGGGSSAWDSAKESPSRKPSPQPAYWPQSFATGLGQYYYGVPAGQQQHNFQQQ